MSEFRVGKIEFNHVHEVGPAVEPPYRVPVYMTEEDVRRIVREELERIEAARPSSANPDKRA